MLSTQTRFWLLLFVFSIGLIVFGRWAADRSGLLWGFAIAFSVNSLIYFYADQRLIELFTAEPLDGHDPWGVLEVIRALSLRSGILAPKTYLIETPAAQAFCAGRSVSRGRIFLTSGLLKYLTKDELEAVVALQIVHLKLNDGLAFSALSLLVGAFLSFTRLVDQGIYWFLEYPKDIERNQGGILTSLLAPLISILLRACLSPSNYLEADGRAAQLTGNKRALASALWKLESLGNTRPLTVPASTAHLFVVNPLTENGWFRYFRVQPKVSTRTKELVGQYPI